MMQQEIERGASEGSWQWSPCCWAPIAGVCIMTLSKPCMCATPASFPRAVLDTSGGTQGRRDEHNGLCGRSRMPWSLPCLQTSVR